MHAPTTLPILQVKRFYSKNEMCWIDIGECAENSRPILSPGRVVEYFTTPQHSEPFYIIEMVDEYRPHFEVRDFTQMTDRPDGVLPYSTITPMSGVESDGNDRDKH